MTKWSHSVTRVRSMLLAFFVALPAGQTPIRFAHSLGSHMVLQQAPKRAIVWGFCDPSTCASVQVTLVRFSEPSASQTMSATLGADAGTFVAKLPATAGSDTPYAVVVTDGSTRATITDVLFGDVWVCSGQSNMAFLLQNMFNGSTYVNNSAQYTTLRMMTSYKTDSKTPLDEQPKVEEVWSVSSPEAVSMDLGSGVGDDNWLYMSAVCYLFGLEVLQQTGKPVGLVNTNWGGTHVEYWMSPDANAQCKDALVPAGENGAWNGMIKPLLNMTIKGAIWYQGEANTGDPFTEVDSQGLAMMSYGCHFPAMISDWRSKWSKGTSGETDAEFPFGYAQLAAWINFPNTAALRWSQSAGFPSVPNARMPNVFSSIGIDLLDRTSPYGSVHIRDKVAVGHRLAAGARATVYGNTSTYWGGPYVSSATSTSSATTVTFTNVGAEGIEVRNASGWEVCTGGGATTCAPNATGSWAFANVTASSTHTVTLDAPSSVVRYAWGGAPFEYKAAGVYARAEDYPAGGFVVAVAAE